MAEENELAWRTLPEVVVAARAFLDPVLGGEPAAAGSPVTWR